MSDAVAGAVEDIADAIETHGWMQGHAGDPTTGFCITGAADYKIERQDLRIRALKSIANGLPNIEYISIPGCGCTACLDGGAGFACVAWNDREGRTRQEVLDHLRLTAKKERE